MNAIRAILVVSALAIGLVAAGAAQSAGGESVALQAADGAAVYQTSCASCHQADGSGIPGAFPPLAGNPAVEDGDYVATVIRDGLSGPLEVLGETYNSAMAPVALSDAEIDAVVSYVQTLGSTTPTPTTTSAPVEANPNRGESLFEGSGFANGGAACQACHSAGPVGFRGGSGLGPDLTDVHQRLGGDAGLTAWLSAPPSPTMRPIFDDKPLTSGEIADLTAFFASVSNDEPDGGFDQLILGGLIGLALLLGLMLVARGSRQTYAQRLRRQR